MEKFSGRGVRIMGYDMLSIFESNYGQMSKGKIRWKMCTLFHLLGLGTIDENLLFFIMKFYFAASIARLNIF